MENCIVAIVLDCLCVLLVRACEVIVEEERVALCFEEGSLVDRRGVGHGSGEE